MKKVLEEIDVLQKEINQFRPLNEEMTKQIREYYRIGFTYSSNAMEGNSLTETETKVVLEDGITIGGKPLRDHYEAVGHSEAFDMLYSIAKTKSVTEDNIKKMHYLFYRRIDESNAGIYRKTKAIITGSKYPTPNPVDVPEHMQHLPEKAEALRKNYHPVEFAAVLHKEFVFIHPFVDGNGRVARLIMNLALLQEGYSIAVIAPLLRQEYMRSLEKAHTDDKDFIELIAQSVKETQRDYLRLFK